METNPLEKITNWLKHLSTDSLKELIALAGHFHPKKEIYQSDGQEQVNLFISYLEDKTLDDREIVIRTFLITRLIDYALSGRDTEAGWTETLDRHISMGARLKEKGQSTEIVDSFVTSYEKRKDIWIETSNDWYRFKESSINDQLISNWYFSKTFN